MTKRELYLKVFNEMSDFTSIYSTKDGPMSIKDIRSDYVNKVRDVIFTEAGESNTRFHSYDIECSISVKRPERQKFVIGVNVGLDALHATYVLDIDNHSYSAKYTNTPVMAILDATT